MERFLSDTSGAENLIAAAGKIRIFGTARIGFGQGK